MLLDDGSHLLVRDPLHGMAPRCATDAASASLVAHQKGFDKAAVGSYVRPTTVPALLDRASKS
jgi:hypothetical protein